VDLSGLVGGQEGEEGSAETAEAETTEEA